MKVFARFGADVARPACGPARRLRPAHRRPAQCCPRAASAWRHPASALRPGNASLPPSMRASAPMGVRQEPSSASRKPRSAAMAISSAGTDMRASNSRVSASSARQVMASAPWPGAGGMSSTSISDVAWCCRPMPGQARQRQEGGVHRAVAQLLQPRLDAAAQGDDFKIGPQMQGLGLAAQAGGADHRALRQRRQIVRLVAR